MVCLTCNFGTKILFGEEIAILAKRLAIITDSNVVQLHSEALSKKLGPVDHTFFPFLAGESFKTRKTKERLEDLLLSNGFGKDCAIVGFGGGVVTDLAGFLAATYLRGVPFYAIPTTLLGMVDASIGGKTGVNMQLAKNAIGCFYPAKTVFIAPSFLTTLPQKEKDNGMAEIYKYAFIADPSLLHETDLTTLIEKSCQVKKRVVEEDAHDSGFRRILNFGHTIGHALEAASNYQIAHGHAVALGMRAESWISHALGHLQCQDLTLIEETLKRYPKPPALAKKKVFDALAHDKKPGFVMLEKIGSPVCFDGAWCSPVEEELIEEALARLC